MNLTESIAPKADQVNADDLIASPRTVTIVEVKAGNAEQPVWIVTEEFGTARPYKPSKSMRRVLVTAWGADSSNYAGQKVTLFRNPKIRFGKDEVGGIQISHITGITESLRIALTVSRGKREPFVVQPLILETPKDTSGRDWLKELSEAGGDVDLLFALGTAANNANAAPAVMKTISAEYNRVKAGPADA